MCYFAIGLTEVFFMLTEETLRETAGEEAFAQGRTLFLRALVREARRAKDEIIYQVSGEEKHTVSLSAAAIRCDCGKHPCAHAVAAALTALESGSMQELERRRAQQAVPALFDAVYSMLPETDGIRLSPALFLTREGLRIGLKIGEDRLYVVRHLPQFLQCREEKKNLPFGKGFEYNPQWMRFDEKQNQLLDILAEYCESASQTKYTGAEARVLLLPGKTAVRVLSALRDMPFTLQAGEEKITLPGVEKRMLPLNEKISI